MPKILKVEKPEDFISYVGGETRHPLVGVVEFEKVSPMRSSLNDYEVYGLFMHSRVRDDLTYGVGSFGNSSGSLICVAPGQRGGLEDTGELIVLDGWALLFHPGLLVGTNLAKCIGKFSFFDYSANEAVFLTENEKKQLTALVRYIQDEIENPRDAEQDAIIVSMISAMLHICNRAYSRQFRLLRHTGNDILIRLSTLINEYYSEELQLKHGVPGVRYFADKLCISPNYLSDLMKKTTGESVSNFIRSQIVRIAKNMLVSSGNISQTAYGMGFDYPQHFSRMFKKHTGMTPSEYLTTNQR